ncbi:MAG TPA: hypothetical protein VE870_15060 [Bacteroidales bacterium]|nr:hypothetical protein [Bacteroidales bacterium]
MKKRWISEKGIGFGTKAGMVLISKDDKYPPKTGSKAWFIIYILSDNGARQ